MSNEFLNDPEFQVLISDYLDYLKSSLPSVKENIDSGNFEDIRKFGHNLKGTGTGYGYENFSKMGKTIEQAAIDEKSDSLTELLERFDTMVTEAHEQFHSK
jgi:HPt (histidine-containing phosphotransfer) domain-containing protein